MNSTAITANDTAVRLSSLWNLNCSLVAGGADDPLHLVRAPNARLGYGNFTRERQRMNRAVSSAEPGKERGISQAIGGNPEI